MKEELEAGAKVAEAFSKPLVKRIDVVADGVGAVAGPPLAVLKAHCEGKAALIRESCGQLLRRLEARHAEELRALPSPAPRQLPARGELAPGEIEVLFEDEDRTEVARAVQSFAVKTLQQRANAMAVVGEGADTIGDTVSDDPVDSDWATRFLVSTQDVSTPQLQKLWGKLLAREVEEPGAVPLRTLGSDSPNTRSGGSRTVNVAAFRASIPIAAAFATTFGRSCRRALSAR